MSMPLQLLKGKRQAQLKPMKKVEFHRAHANAEKSGGEHPFWQMRLADALFSN